MAKEDGGRGMKKDNFRTGIESLEKAFQGYKFNYEFLWDNLKDMDDVCFDEAIKHVILSLKFINENTNLVALMTEAAKRSPYYGLPNQKF